MIGLPAITISNASAVLATTNLLVEDTFSRTGPFVGSTPDVGGSWTGGGATWTTNGSELSTSSNGFAYIGIGSLATNETYTLSMNVTVNSGSWIGFGFGNAATTSVNFGADASLLHRQSANAELFSIVDGSDSFSVPAGFPKELEIEIETGASLANSTVTWSVNGSQIGASRVINASGIDRVFLEEFGGTTGVVDTFRLETTEAVPEPSSALLMGLGMLGLLRRRRS